ncbi:MAG: hypothetical protein E7505_04270 [Ruminococcus sp.]|nr:hypothetical protein [Ruminococcus sp.]
MAKITLDQKIAKVEEQILKEELTIEEIRGKIKSLKAERRKLIDEKEKKFANEIMKIIKEKGINQEELITELKRKESDNKSEGTENKNSETTQFVSDNKTSINEK